jgi:hypothetical protein
MESARYCLFLYNQLVQIGINHFGKSRKILQIELYLKLS